MMIVIYHANCCDGFCGAWILSKVYPDAKFLPFSYGMPAPIDQLRGEDVIIVDFCFSLNEMVQLRQVVNSLKVFDHHKSVDERLRGWEEFVFDEKETGCSLVFKHYANRLNERHELDGIGILNIPWIVAYVKDRDLWEWKLPHSAEINAGIRFAPMTFTSWDRLDSAECFRVGMTLVDYWSKQVERSVEICQWVQVPFFASSSFLVPIVNVSNFDLISLVGEALAKLPEAPFGMTYYTRTIKNDQLEFVFSLRSSGDFDVSKLAEFYGGGGHHNSAGFRARQNVPFLGRLIEYC